MFPTYWNQHPGSETTHINIINDVEKNVNPNITKKELANDNVLAETGYDIHLRLVPLDYIVNEVGYNPLKNYVIMKEKGLFKTYEAVSTDVKYGEKPQHIEDEEIGQLVQGALRQESNAQRSD